MSKEDSESGDVSAKDLTIVAAFESFMEAEYGVCFVDVTHQIVDLELEVDHGSN